MQSYNPRAARHTGLGSSLFARHYSGNHYYFLFLRVLRCFSSPRWLLFLGDAPSVQQVVPFGYLRIYRSCAAPRSFSQLTTSFIASQTLGIHHTPLFALKKFIVSWTCTISKVQTRPLAIIHQCIITVYFVTLIFTTYFPNMSKNLPRIKQII